MPIGTRMRSVNRCNFQWPRMIPNPDLKVTSLFNVNISKTIRGRPIVTADHYKVLCGLLNCAIASDLHWLQFISGTVKQFRTLYVYEVNYNARTSYVSKYFWCRIRPQGILYDAEHYMLAMAEFLIRVNHIFCRQNVTLFPFKDI